MTAEETWKEFDPMGLVNLTKFQEQRVISAMKFYAEEVRKKEQRRHKSLIKLITQIRSMMQQGSAGSHYANRITEALKVAGYETEERK